MIGRHLGRSLTREDIRTLEEEQLQAAHAAGVSGDSLGMMRHTMAALALKGRHERWPLSLRETSLKPAGIT